MQQRGLRTRQLECEAFLLSSTFTPPCSPTAQCSQQSLGLDRALCAEEREKKRERERAPGQVVGGSQS